MLEKMCNTFCPGREKGQGNSPTLGQDRLYSSSPQRSSMKDFLKHAARSSWTNWAVSKPWKLARSPTREPVAGQKYG